MTGVLGLPSEMTEREAGLASVGQLGRFGKSLQAHTVKVEIFLCEVEWFAGSRCKPFLV